MNIKIMFHQNKRKPLASPFYSTIPEPRTSAITTSTAGKKKCSKAIPCCQYIGPGNRGFNCFQT